MRASTPREQATWKVYEVDFQRRDRAAEHGRLGGQRDFFVQHRQKGRELLVSS
jgi:hypothetical protein